MDNINRVQYGKPDVSDRQAPFSAQLGMYWLYFKWQWFRDVHGLHPGMQNMLAAVFLILGLFGGYAHWKYDRRSFWFFGPLIFTVTIALIVYLNFKYGYSESPELGDTVAREVRDRDYFYLWSFSAWSVWVALGLVFLWESVAAVFGTEVVGPARSGVEQPTKRAWLLDLVGCWRWRSFRSSSIGATRRVRDKRTRGTSPKTCSIRSSHMASS